AVGRLATTGQVKTTLLQDFVIMGELSLNGALCPVRGALPIAILAREQGFRCLILPKSNAPEAAVIDGFEVYGAEDISQVVALLNGSRDLLPASGTPYVFSGGAAAFESDFDEVKGQENI